MKITDLLKKDAIALNTAVASKSEAIDKMISLHNAVGNLSDVDSYRQYLPVKTKAQQPSARELQFLTQNQTA